MLRLRVARPDRQPPRADSDLAGDLVYKLRLRVELAIDEEPEGLACVEDGGDMVPLPIVDWKAGMNLCSTPGSGAGRDPGEEMPRAAVFVTFASKAEDEGALTGDPIVLGNNIRDS